MLLTRKGDPCSDEFAANGNTHEANGRELVVAQRLQYGSESARRCGRTYACTVVPGGGRNAITQRVHSRRKVRLLEGSMYKHMHKGSVYTAHAWGFSAQLRVADCVYRTARAPLDTAAGASSAASVASAGRAARRSTRPWAHRSRLHLIDRRALAI